jgi:hypothetical protein
LARFVISGDGSTQSFGQGAIFQASGSGTCLFGLGKTVRGLLDESVRFVGFGCGW